MPPRPQPRNPFRFGDLAIDESFANREEEIAELKADALNGQNVVIIAPRRYGKTSLITRVASELVREDVLVAQVDLMTTPTKEQLVERLMRAVNDDIATPLLRARDAVLGLFRGLRIAPRITVEPTSGAFAFSLDGSYSSEDVDATLINLLELPAQLSAERGRRVVLIFDEFQEITLIDPKLPQLLRSVFQQQPDVSHIYLGSRRHMMEKIFNDENEPFWRSAKQIELGAIAEDRFVPFIERRFRGAGKKITSQTARQALAITGGHPYATQQLAYALWEATGGAPAGETELTQAVAGVLRSENSYFTRIWEDSRKQERLLLQALAREPGRVFASDYRARHKLGAASTVQYSVSSLAADELIGRDPAGGYRIVEPFLAQWVERHVEA